MGDRAGAVADDLHFDVSRVLDESLDVDVVVAERSLGSRAAPRIGLGNFTGFAHGAHAASAAARHRLDHHRTTIERLEERQGFVKAGRPDRAFDDRHADLRRKLAGRDLVAEQLQRTRRGADERDLLLSGAPRQIGVLAEKPVAGMDLIAADFAGNRNDTLDVEIARSSDTTERMLLISLA